MNLRNTLFLYEQHFYKQRQAEIGKNQEKAKQHPEAEPLYEQHFYKQRKAEIGKKSRKS